MQGEGLAVSKEDRKSGCSVKQEEKRKGGRRSGGDLGRQREVNQEIDFSEIPDADMSRCSEYMWWCWNIWRKEAGFIRVRKELRCEVVLRRRVFAWRRNRQLEINRGLVVADVMSDVFYVV